MKTKVSKSWMRQKRKIERESFPVRNRATKTQKYIIAFLLIATGITMTHLGLGIISFLPTMLGALIIYNI